MKSILVENLSFGYTEDKVLDGLSLSINKGEMVAITGGNGSGKSTLMRLILGELIPQEGTIKLAGKELEDLKSFQRIGYVPQGNVMDKIAFPLTCKELVILNLYADFGIIKIPRQRHKKRAKELLTEMGLSQYINVPFNELSGGLQQRVLISRAMINNPEILILDEPTAGVDDQSKNKFAELIQKLNKRDKLTILLVTHEIEWAKENLKFNHIYQINKGVLKKC